MRAGSIGACFPSRVLEEVHVPEIPPTSRRGSLRRAFVTLVAIMALAVPAIVLAAKPPATGQTTAIKILDISDWHAQLDPQGIGTPPVNIGGAEALSDYFKAERAGSPNSITVTAGDDFGAAPPRKRSVVRRRNTVKDFTVSSRSCCCASAALSSI